MSTQPLSQVKQSLTKQVKKAKQAEQPLPQPQQSNPAAPLKNKLATATGDYGLLQVVTSNRLKRRFCNNGYETKLYIPDNNYAALSIDGLSLGVTMDEVIRGLIEQHLASTDRLNGLKHFIPALQV